MKIVIVGNGIIGLMIAYRLVNQDRNLSIEIVGPEAHPGCASLAAAAMFNSFCEIDSGTLENPIEEKKFLFNKESNRYWPSLLKEIETQSNSKLEYGFGTFLINNTVSDKLEDENFDAILYALQKFNEPFERISPADIPHYKPGSSQRAGRAILIEREGWVNPILLIASLKVALHNTGRVKFTNGFCESVKKRNEVVAHVKLHSGQEISGDRFILCPGANFSTIIDRSDLGIDLLRIFYGVGCSILLNTGTNTISNCIRTPNRGLACGVYSAPQDNTHTLIGASNFISPVPVNNVRVTSVYTLLKSAIEQINSDYYRAELVKVNVGWRPTSADTLPLIGQTSISNLIVVTGTKRDGLHCSPVISEYVSDLLLKGKSSLDLSLFNPERKKVKVYSREEAIRIAVRHTINAAYQHDFVPAKNRMVEHLEKFYYDDYSKLHDAVGAHDWGIPPEMMDMYRYNHVQ
jgi:glycine oxidase